MFMKTFYRTSLVAASVFCKDFVNISYDNSHTHTRRLFVDAACLFLKYTFRFIYEMSFFYWWDTYSNYLKVIQNFLCVLLSALNSQNSRHSSINFTSTIGESNQVKVSHEIMRCQGYFLKNWSWDEVVI